jgi:hypothetical protein
MIRFEILLPLFYNDGRQIEPEKFTATDRQLLSCFGGVATDTVSVRGKWQYENTLYSDELMRLRVDVEDTPESWDAMRSIKEDLKARFEQIDIWITAHRIDVL